jgi:hypothetical protein
MKPIEEGKYYKFGRRKCLVGKAHYTLGVWQKNVVYLDKNGRVTGSDILYFCQPNSWIEIEPILIKRRYIDDVIDCFTIPFGWYSKYSESVLPKNEEIEIYLQ